MGLRKPPPAERPMLPVDTFKGQIALVTGGGSGLGLSMALGLARCGATIAITSRSIDKLENGLARIRATGATAIPVVCDVREPEQVAAAFDTVERELGPVDMLLNNAGANFPVLAENISPNAWRAIVRIALDGTFFCCREFYLRRRKLDRPGVIINNGANYGWTGFPGDAHSCAAKAGSMNLTMTLAAEWAADGIRVNGIVPGFYPHEGTILESDSLGLSIPAQRCGELQEISWAAAYLCSPYASFLTGINYLIDGADVWRRSVIPSDYVPVRERGDAIW
jgi:NAD(P)-dependent dehydrogenase (short-subunit alcohol dehydrogenase family)